MTGTLPIIAAMVEPGPVEASAGDIVVLVGTSKGLFVLTAGREREAWELAGPWFRGQEIAAAVLVPAHGGA